MAQVFKVAQDRVARNPKELTVTAGEFVEVLDDTKNWWKVSNINNESGFVPRTLLIALKVNNGGSQNEAKESSTSQPNRTNQASPALSGAIHQKQEEFLTTLKAKHSMVLEVAQDRVGKITTQFTVTVEAFVEVNVGIQNGAKESSTSQLIRSLRVFKVAKDRVGRNPKELTVTAGEFVVVLEDTKNWWKVSNMSNECGYVPNTILIAV